MELTRRKINSIFGCVIKTQRKKKGFSGAEIAKYLGVSQQQLSRYESGSCNINMYILMNISYLLGINIIDFFFLIEREMISSESDCLDLFYGNSKSLTYEARIINHLYHEVR